MRYCFYPWERLTRERAETVLRIGKVQRVLVAILPHGSETGNGAPDFWLQPGAPHHWGQGPVAGGGLKPNSVMAVESML